MPEHRPEAEGGGAGDGEGRKRIAGGAAIGAGADQAALMIAMDPGLGHAVIEIVARSRRPVAILARQKELLADPVGDPGGAVAEEDSEVIRVNRVLFRRILEEFPEVAVRLHEKMTAKFSDFAEQVIRLKPRFDG